jgi:ABC-2 type transport system permease protein
MLLANGDNGQFIYPSGEINESGVRTAIESALKRSTTGFLKVIGLWTPPNAPLNDPVLGGCLQPMVSYQALQQQLGQEYTLQTVDLSQGRVPAEIDVLVLIAPADFTAAELYAVDQYLMRGGSLVVAASSYGLAFDNFTQGFTLYPVNNGIAPLLSHYGINLADGVVMDTQNAPFPVVTVRSVQGTAVQEVQAVDYPFFVDIRPNRMSEESVITSNIPAVTLSYASPVELDPDRNAARETAVLLSTSDNAWLRLNGDITPNFALYPETGFSLGSSRQQFPLAIAVQGQFASYFEARELPGQAADAESSSTPRLATITQSPDTARLVVIGSSSFMEDLIMDLTAVFQGEAVLSNVQLLQNSIDWAVEDLDLLSIRARGAAVRVLNPLTPDEQRVYELANYIFALLALSGIFVVWRLRRQTAPLLWDDGAAAASVAGGGDE